MANLISKPLNVYSVVFLASGGKTSTRIQLYEFLSVFINVSHRVTALEPKLRVTVGCTSNSVLLSQHVPPPHILYRDDRIVSGP